MKSNRTRIESLVLINWNGFFFQRFEMDETVTALEGENGAGKTNGHDRGLCGASSRSAVAAVSKCLRRGRSQGDRGLFGRLGARGVAYTILELGVQDGKRMLAGVMVRKKTPPSLELTPFIVEGLPADVSFATDAFNPGKRLERCQLHELSRRLGQSGASFKVCDSVGQYTASLFELGITPMRMESYAEREKLTACFRPACTGGCQARFKRGCETTCWPKTSRFETMWPECAITSTPAG